MAMLGGITRREEEAAGGGAAAPELRHPHHHQVVFEAGGMLGLAVASAAITFAVSQPPPWLHWDDAYFAVALSGAFFVGVAQVGRLRRLGDHHWCAPPHRREQAPVHAPSVALLGVAAGLELASLMLP